MTRERIEDMREVVLPFVKKRLLETNYEGLGKSDAEEFTRDFNEILELAIKALEQEPISDILEDIYFDIEKEYEDCVIGKLDDDDNIMNPCFRQITDIYGVLDIIGKYIDKYKPGSEEEDGNDD